MTTTSNGLRAAGCAMLLLMASAASAQPPQGPGGAREEPAPPAAERSGAPEQDAAGQPNLRRTSQAREPDVVVDAVIRRLANEMGKDFLVDPRVPPRLVGRGSIEGPLSYEAFLTVLANNGFVAVEVGDYISIVPEQNTRHLPSPVVQTDDPNIPDQQIVTRVLTLPPGTLDPAQLVPLLRPMQSQSAHLAALPAAPRFAAVPDGPGPTTGGTLIIVDRYANVRRIAAVLDEILRGVSGGAAPPAGR